MKIYVSLLMLAACGALACSCKQEAPKTDARWKTFADGNKTDLNTGQTAFEKRQAQLQKKKAAAGGSAPLK